MLLSHLETFVKVIEHQSFSKAAQELFLSQPTISAQIQSLEKEFDTQLITRSTKKLSPTADGKTLYKYAVEIISLCNKAKSNIKHDSKELAGTIEIACSTVPSTYILPPVLTELSKKYPDLYYLIHQCDSNDVIRKVIRMECNIGITGSTFSKGNCEFVPFFEDRLGVITPNTEPYISLKGNMPTEMLKTAPFISRELGSGTKKEYEVFLNSIGITNKDMNFIAQMFNTESILNAVKSGLGISIVSKIAADNYAFKGDLLFFDFDTPLLSRNLYFVYRKNEPLPSIVQLLLEQIRDYCANNM